MNRIAVLAMLVLLIAIAAVACGGGEETGPEPSPPPTGPTAASLLVKGDPEDLVIQLEALPPGFQRVTGEYEEVNGYTVVYFCPETLFTEGHSETSLLGVVVNLNIYDDVTGAREQFHAQGNLDRDSIMNDIREASEDATPLDVQPYTVQLEGTDEVLAFRVQYAIGSIVMFEYRYRFIVGNALANVIITARALETGEEPSTFPDKAQAIVEEQIARLNSARS